ncbi:hypothetical protein BLNAU_17050 [Blattamonas nauphoetae]|uniref:Uncharacterized protein n=1 Tax=Blattamonas nauphoetae TaxID=2049346 RepID=A0ABQ9X9D5_9EUKA|nr:hypothetical protein BLNAU_17050 [Blattamonas nauphoetae]
MEEYTDYKKTSDDASLNGSPSIHSIVKSEDESFLRFDSHSELSFDDQSRIYNSLVALVKAEYPFGKTLQDRAVQFLKSIEPDGREPPGHANQLVTDLVPSSAESPSGLVDSILTLVSSPHSIVAEAALSFLHKTIACSSPTLLTNLTSSDLVSNVLETIQPHPLPISGNEKLLSRLIKIFALCIDLASPWSLINLGITTAFDAFNHREMIFRKVVLPSSRFVTFLISNRHILSGDLLISFVNLLSIHLRIGPYHRPTLEFVLASPIAMTFTSCLSDIEYDYYFVTPLMTINGLLKEWKNECPEVAESAKRMIQALFSEGFEDTLEQMLMKRCKEGLFIRGVVDDCHTISQKLGSNVTRPQ